MKILENYGVQEMGAKEIKVIEGGYEWHPGGCSYSGGGMIYEGPILRPNNDRATQNLIDGLYLEMHGY